MITMSATTNPIMMITPLVSPPVTGALDVVGVCAHADHDSAATIMKARTPHTHVNSNASDHLMTRSSLHPDRPGELDDVISPSCAAQCRRLSAERTGEVVKGETALAAEVEVGRGVDCAAPPHIHHPAIPLVAFHLNITAQQWTMRTERRTMMARRKGEHD